MSSDHPSPSTSGASGNHDNPRYAYATTIFGDDVYVGTALVLAHSLKSQGTKAHVVVMVCPDVSAEGKAALRRVFDEVKEVDFLEGRVGKPHGGKRFKKFYDHWLPKCFTKFQAYLLTQYDKICLLDADMVAVKNPDAIFELKAPAGICSIVKESENLHGKPIPKGTIRRSLSEYGIRGCLLLLKPSEQEYYKILEVVREKPDPYEREGFIGPDEKMLTELYRYEWTHVSSAYGCTAWKTDGLTPIILHYVSEKPWNATEEWPDLKIWWDNSEELIAKYGEDLRRFFPKPQYSSSKSKPIPPATKEEAGKEKEEN